MLVHIIRYTASALSYMLENLGKIVVVTGSQLPLLQAYSDARQNLVLSLLFAAHVDVPEVTILFNNVLLRGCRAKKVDATSTAGRFCLVEYRLGQSPL